MRIAEAEAELHAILAPHGVGTPALSMATAWRVFCDFARRPVTDTASDGVLFQAGTYSFSGVPLFTVGLTRQFERLDPNGGHAYYEQLQCELTFDPESGESWSTWFFSGEDWDRFVADVEAHSTFRAACEKTTISSELWQERV